MKVSEIIESIDIMIPNSIPAPEKIKWLNQIHNQLYRDYQLQDGIMKIQIITGQSFYPLPPDCTEESGRNLIIDGKEVPFIALGEDIELNPYEPYWSVVQGAIFINPEPTRSAPADFYYRRHPKQLTQSDMETVPDLPIDYHELYVFGCCARLAKLQPATLPLADTFQADYMRLAEKADLMLTKRRQTTVRIWRQFQ